MPASRQATGADLPCAIDTSIWRSSVTICSAPNRFFDMTSSFPSYSLTTFGLKEPGLVIRWNHMALLSDENCLCRLRLLTNIKINDNCRIYRPIARNRAQDRCCWQFENIAGRTPRIGGIASAYATRAGAIHFRSFSSFGAGCARIVFHEKSKKMNWRMLDHASPGSQIFLLAHKIILVCSVRRLVTLLEYLILLTPDCINHATIFV